jgi:hypothetical protein
VQRVGRAVEAICNLGFIDRERGTHVDVPLAGAVPNGSGASAARVRAHGLNLTRPLLAGRVHISECSLFFSG